MQNTRSRNTQSVSCPQYNKTVSEEVILRVYIQVLARRRLIA